MGKLIMRDQSVWLGGYSIGGIANSLALDYGAESKDQTVLGDLTRTQLAGLKTFAAGLQGLWDPANGLDAELFGRVGLADAPMSWSPIAAAEGGRAFSCLAHSAEYSIAAGDGEVLEVTGSANAASGDGLVRGTLMHIDAAAETATGSGTGQQLGAVATGQKLFGALHVLAGSGSLDLILESDDSNAFLSPTTRITFANQTGIGYEWAVPVDGPITDDWWRLSWTIAGGTPSFTFVAVAAIQ